MGHEGRGKNILSHIVGDRNKSNQESKKSEANPKEVPNKMFSPNDCGLVEKEELAAQISRPE